MSRLRFWLIEVLTLALTRIWGHLLIPVLLGSILYGCTGLWLGWELPIWLAWVSSMLVIGWVLTLASWIRFYWEKYTDIHDGTIVVDRELLQRDFENVTDTRDDGPVEVVKPLAQDE